MLGQTGNLPRSKRLSTDIVRCILFLFFWKRRPKSRHLIADAMAKIFVYSMAIDGPSRSDTDSSQNSGEPPLQLVYLAGSKALDSLDRVITSTESFFHPSNSGPWTLSVCNTRSLCVFSS